MIKQGLKNFFVNLKYVFTPMGCLFLGALIGVSIAVPVIQNAISEFVSGANKLMTDNAVQFESFFDAVISDVRALDWSDTGAALATLLSRDWLTDTLMANVEELTSAGAANVEKLGALATDAANAFFGAVAAIAVFSFLGLVLGYFFVKFLIRRDIARRNIPKFIFGILLDSLASALFVAAGGVFAVISKAAGFIALAVILLLSAIITLLKAYLLHGMKKMRMRELVNAKNLFKLLASDALIFLVCAAFITVVFFIFNIVVALFVGVCFVQIAIIVISLNAEAYTVSMVKDRVVPSEAPAA